MNAPDIGHDPRLFRDMAAEILIFLRVAVRYERDSRMDAVNLLYHAIKVRQRHAVLQARKTRGADHISDFLKRSKLYFGISSQEQQRAQQGAC